MPKPVKFRNFWVYDWIPVGSRLRCLFCTVWNVCGFENKGTLLSKDKLEYCSPKTDRWRYDVHIRGFSIAINRLEYRARRARCEYSVTVFLEQPVPEGSKNACFAKVTYGCRRPLRGTFAKTIKHESTALSDDRSRRKYRSSRFVIGVGRKARWRWS